MKIGRQIWKYALEQVKYNPFEEELILFNDITIHEHQVATLIEEKEEVKRLEQIENVIEEERRRRTPIEAALNEFCVVVEGVN